MGTQKAAQSSSINGESPAQKKCSENSISDGSSAKESSQCRSRSSSRDKGSVDQSISSMELSAENSYAPYDNVFFSNQPLSPEELFDNSWSDSDSEEFSDSEVENSTAAQQVSCESECVLTDMVCHSLNRRAIFFFFFFFFSFFFMQVSVIVNLQFRFHSFLTSISVT